MFFFSLPLGGDGSVGESWLLAHAWQIGRSRLGRTGWGLGTFDAPVLKATFNSPKISWIVFLYRDFGEHIEYPRIFDVTSETRDNSSVIILKSRLTLQVILPARTSLVTPSLIDYSRCALALSTTAPVRNITKAIIFIVGPRAFQGTFVWADIKMDHQRFVNKL